MKKSLLNIGLIFLVVPFFSFWSMPELNIKNGWITYNNEVIWGNGQRTDFWGGYRECAGNTDWIINYKKYTAITRNDPGNYGPCKTEDLDKLTDAMLQYGYPAFMYNYGLWYDRRRDCHDEEKRNSSPVAPFYEQPWARSNIEGAWDGGNKYDLVKYNSWYFDRLKEFAGLCDKKGTILIHQYYLQHNLLESPCHYVDFPWRPINCIQPTGMPDTKPVNDLSAYNTFYDLSDSTMRYLHRAYIRKCLDELSDYRNVIHEISGEYTGPLSFTQFWIDTIIEWQKETGKKVIISLAACKDVQDAILADPIRFAEINIINLTSWWYLSDGKLNAPIGGTGVPGRYAIGPDWAKETTPYQIYRQVKEYRLKFPNKAIIHSLNASREQTIAFLMAGGSLLIRWLLYPDSQPPLNPWDPPSTYIMPENSAIILPVYQFIRQNLKSELQNMTIKSIVLNNTEQNWCLGQSGKNYLVYALKGGNINIDLKEESGISFKAIWVNPQNGEIQNANGGVVIGGDTLTLNAPNTNDWLLWLSSSIN